MPKKKTNLSVYNKKSIPSAKALKIALVVSEWNPEITEALYKGSEETLIAHGSKKNHISRYDVPGSFELIAGAKYAAEKTKVDAVICIGCVIKGETRHFEFISNAVANGIMQLNLQYKIPFIFGVLTTNTFQQAKDRAGGKHGNKGVEAAITAIRMAGMKK